MTLTLLLSLFAAYALAVICALAFVTNLTRCLKFLVLSRNVELTVEQQKLFGVTDFGLCHVLAVIFGALALLVEHQEERPACEKIE